MLHEFITLNREEIITRCRAKVATRLIPMPSEAEINHGVPLFLDQLVDALHSGGRNSLEIGASAGQHGHDLLLKGFTVSQVVHDYGDVCQTITELALETNAPINTDDFRMLNGCLDNAIAVAVTMYERESQQSHSDKAADRNNERMGFLVHELRNLVNTAVIAFEVLKSGNVGVAGSTGAVLHRSLMGLRDLIARSLDEIRLTHGVMNKKRILVAIEADEPILAAVVGNLLQNAFKFTRPHSTVRLLIGASVDRVLIEVHDECGGLPGGDVTELFGPFEQRGADRTGLGIGLGFSRWGAEANGGRLYARNLPEKGCVFTVDLPQSPVPAVVPA
jgi:signal transduction histidine kinase